MMSPTGLDAMKRMLNLDPEKRPSASEMLKHPFFSCFRQKERETSTKRNRSIRVASSTYRNGKISGVRDSS